MAIVPQRIKLPAILPSIFPLRVVITKDPMVVIDEYKNRVNEIPATNSFKTKEAKRLDSMLDDAIKLQNEQDLHSEVYEAWNDVIKDITAKLPRYVGKGPDYLKLNYPSSSEELKQ
jgi:hypothetical protein